MYVIYTRTQLLLFLFPTADLTENIKGTNMLPRLRSNLGNMYGSHSYKTICKYCRKLMTNEMHNSYNQILFHSFLSALRVSNESSRSSSGARHNILYYTVWYNRYNRAGLHDCTKLCNTVYYAVLLMMND